MSLTGSTVLVTGASRGIGRETAVLLSSLNARVVLVGRNRVRLGLTLSSLFGEGHRVAAFDLARTEEIPEWFQSLASELPCRYKQPGFHLVGSGFGWKAGYFGL